MRKMITLNNGFQLPVLGYGTYRIKEPEIIKPLIEKALCTGYRLFDTAAVYQNEEYIGQVLQDKIRQGELKRENVFITSKL
ncbi:aldo-keto reductase family 1 member C13-like, partial [Limulus polyphemus]|uniref:Aldo-keto reductase family 1 member C13-like n=1 Tax=Limulus polyphemus TaxID=6850 RepID=A0ABM1TM51_LIMPO